MFETIFKWLLITQLVLQFFYAVYIDFNGREAKQPMGFQGFIGTVVAILIFGAVLYGAGVFDGLVATSHVASSTSE
jgi:hypothetical protein